MDMCVGCGQRPLLNLQGAVLIRALPAALVQVGRVFRRECVSFLFFCWINYLCIYLFVY